MRRREKVMSAENAAAFIKDGDTVAIGGFILQNKPMVMIRALIKRGTKDLFLVTAGPAGIDADMLIGTDRVRRLASSSVNLDWVAPIAPNFRRYVESGKLSLWECGQGVLIAALRASAQGLPFLPTRSGLGTDLLKVNPELKLFQDPLRGETLVAVPAIKLDVAIVHTARSDPYGNAQHGGMMTVFDPIIMAADKMIVTTEEVVPLEVTKADPARITVSCENVVAVVECPYGAHPCATSTCYSFDREAVSEYLKAARNATEFRVYLDKYVYGPKDHEDYLELIGIKRLLALKGHKEEKNDTRI